jgi:hypothetical protein
MAPTRRRETEEGTVGQVELEPADWLRICTGFDVEFPDGRRGRVCELRYRSDPTRPDVLLVRTGRLGRRIVGVAVDDIQAILPNERRLVVRRRRSDVRPRDERGDAAGGIVRFPARHSSPVETSADDGAAHA